MDPDPHLGIAVDPRTDFGEARLGDIVEQQEYRPDLCRQAIFLRSEEHTSELQSLMRISYAVFCLKKKKQLICDTYSGHCRRNPYLYQLYVVGLTKQLVQSS